MSATPLPEDLLLIGTVGQPFGIKGQVKLHSLTSHPEQLRRIKTVFVGPKLVPYQLLQVIEHKPNLLLLRFGGIDTRNAAEELQKTEVFIRSSEAAPLEEAEYFFHDLPGMEVRTLDGQVVGTVKEVLETGANDVLVVERPDHPEVLIPMIHDVVKELNVTTKTITIDPIPGLLE
ncbi:MAG: 16S rRNA processing protein RimM [Herpetosiphonaceae bacterium]|nr:16S rRNA processing protein RimM [Herpetosiphonaceae bacterium]